jgi:signal transduction histidine kinase
LRITAAILGTTLAVFLLSLVMGLRVRDAQRSAESAAAWRSAAAAAAAAASPMVGEPGEVEGALRRLLAAAPAEALRRGLVFAPGLELRARFDSDPGRPLPGALLETVGAVLGDGLARSATGEGLAVHCAPIPGSGAARGGALALVVAAPTRGLSDLSIALLATLCAGLGLALVLGRPLARIERAARGAYPARSLPDLAERIESQLAPGRVDARIARHVQVRTRELEVRLRRQEEVLSNTAHELRTPLTVVMASIGVLRDGFCETEDETRTAIEHAHAAGQHLIFVINDLVDAAAADAGRLRLDLQSQGIDGLLDEIGELLTPIAAARGIRFEVRRPPAGATVHGDRLRILQVVYNLVGNGFKYSPDGSAVELRVAACGPLLRFEILDQGIGVPEDQRDGLFLRFSRVHDPKSSSARGHGLGLHLCKFLVEEMRGRIGYRAREDGPGSVFWFELPRQAAAGAPAS